MPDEPVEIDRAPIGEETALARPRYPAPYGTQAAYGYNYGYPNAEEEGMHLRDMWRIVRKRKWLVMSMTLIVTTVIAVQMYRISSTYQAFTLVEVEKSVPSAGKGEFIFQDS